MKETFILVLGTGELGMALIRNTPPGFSDQSRHCP